MNDSRLLKYSLRERRWIWDLDRIRSMNITDNVLYILTNKMTSLPEHTQGALKVLSCFGIKADTVIVEYLCVTEQQCQLGLDDALKHNFVVRIGSAVQFVHDKVRAVNYIHFCLMCLCTMLTSASPLFTCCWLYYALR